MPIYETLNDQTIEAFDAALERLTEDSDYLIIDTPGRDDPIARRAATRADTLVTPMNDSFVDFDLIGQVHPDTFQVTRPSFYSELIWDARKARAKADGATIDWVVLRNRLQHIEARNMRRVSEALQQLAKRVGFRIIPGLGERVIYRELFPKGLTMIDSREFGEMGLSHVAARQELREMMAALALPEPALPLFACRRSRDDQAALRARPSIRSSPSPTVSTPLPCANTISAASSAKRCRPTMPAPSGEASAAWC